MNINNYKIDRYYSEAYMGASHSLRATIIVNKKTYTRVTFVYPSMFREGLIDILGLIENSIKDDESKDEDYRKQQYEDTEFDVIGYSTEEYRRTVREAFESQ